MYYNKYKSKKESSNYVSDYERKCDICGKVFDIYGTIWSWRTPSKNKWFCSYNCAVKYDKLNENSFMKKGEYYD